MKDFLALCAHPLAARQLRRWRREAIRSRGALAALALATLAAGLAAAARATGLQELPAFHLSDRALGKAQFWLTVAAAFASGAAPWALGWRSLSWLRGGSFEQFLAASADRLEIVRALWLVLWLRSTGWLLAALGAVAGGALALLEWHAASALLRQQVILAIVAPWLAALAASRSVRDILEHREEWPMLWRGALWIFALYPAAIAAAGCVLAWLSFMILGPLWAALGAPILGLYLSQDALRLAGPSLLILAMLPGAATLLLAEVRRNLDAAETWCVPSDWLERQER
jgi:hypothetical protein